MNRRLKKIILWPLGGLCCLYAIACTGFYGLQDKLTFPGTPPWTHPLANNAVERTITASDGTLLNGVLFKAVASKGLVFYLHGNGDKLDNLATIAHYYTDLHYDIFFLDYRGYGKSQGHLTGERQLFSDVQTAYDTLCKTYAARDIVVLGYSIGTCPATMLASRNHPRMLILQAPYYSMRAIATQKVRWLSFTFPTFLLKYPLRTYTYLRAVRAPVVIFHGNQDHVIDIRQSYRLRSFLKPGDRFIELQGQGHDRITGNPVYLDTLRQILSP
jgi:alpha-beta hydrolase superfamily lysophospholipase